MQGPYTPEEWEQYQRLQELYKKDPYIIRKFKSDFWSAFEDPETKIAPHDFFLHPIKTVKGAAKYHFLNKLRNEVGGRIALEVVWNPLLKQEGVDNNVVSTLVQNYITEPKLHKKDQIFKALEKLADGGLVPDKIWRTLQFQKQMNLTGELIGNPLKFSMENIYDFAWRKTFRKVKAVNAFQKYLGRDFSGLIDKLEDLGNLSAVNAFKGLNKLRKEFVGLRFLKEGRDVAELEKLGQTLFQEMSLKHQQYQALGVTKSDNEVINELFANKIQQYDQHYQIIWNERRTGNIDDKDWGLIKRKQAQDYFITGNFPDPRALPKSWELFDPNTGAYNHHIGNLVENFFKATNDTQRSLFFNQLQALRNSGQINDNLWRFLAESRSFLHLRTLQEFKGIFYKLSPSAWLKDTITKKIYPKIGAAVIPRAVDKAIGTAGTAFRELFKKASAKAIQTTAKVAGKAAVKVAAKIGIKVGLKTAVHAVTQAVGTAAPVVGNVIAFAATELVSLSIGWIWKLLKLVFALGCGCFVLLISLVLVVIMGAFWLPKGGMDISEAKGQFILSKRANPSHFSADNKNHVVIYTITIKNNSNKVATNIIVHDETYNRTWPGAFDPAISLNPGEERDLLAFEETILADTDKVITNTARATVEFEDATTTEAIASAYIIIGNPPDAPPCGWPVSGWVTLEFGVPSSVEGTHTGIDVGLGKYDPGQDVFSNINGTITRKLFGTGTYGGFIRITSETGKYYVDLVHLDQNTINGWGLGSPVGIGTLIGKTISGPYGNSSGTHLHYRVYEDGELVNPEKYHGDVSVGDWVDYGCP